MTEKKRPICIYHANCQDGFGSAWTVYQAFLAYNLDQNRPEFYPAKYGKDEEIPDVTGRRVIMVDFSYKRKVLLKMAKRAKHIVIYDHHASAARELVDLPSNVETVFDMERSGAMITWNEQFPKKQPPLLLRHIQDRDLWKFEMPGTKEIAEALYSYPMDFLTWDKLMKDPDAIDKLRSEGEAIARYKNQSINSMIGQAVHRREIDGFYVPCINVPPMWGSDACNILCENEPFAAYFWVSQDGDYEFGLRSSKDGGEDVSIIAEKFGGGGHKHAAGFRFRVPATEEIREVD